MQKTFLRSIYEGLAYSSGFAVILKVVWFGIALVIIAKLSLHQYGTYQIVLAAWGILLVFLLANADQIVIARGAALLRSSEREAISLGLSAALVRACVALALWLLLVLGTPLIDRWYSGDVLEFLGILALTFFIAPLDGVVRYDFAIRKRFFEMNFYIFLEESVKGIGILLSLFVFSGGVAGLLWAAVVASYLKNAFYALHVGPYLRHIKYASFVPFLSVLWSLGKWNIARQQVGQLTSNARIFFIQYFIGREGVALFSLAQKLYTHIASLFPMAGFLIPLISSELQDRARLLHLLERGFKYSVPIFFLMAIAAAIFAPLFLQHFFPAYMPSLPLFFVLLFALPFVGIADILSSFLLSQEEQKAFFFLALAKAAATVIMLPLFLLSFGLFGAALELTFSSIAFVYLRYWLLTRLYPDLKVRAKNVFSFDWYDRELLVRIKNKFLRVQ